jgi:hypothetical protein
MPATERKYPPRTVVLSAVPLRYLAAATTALLLATLLASSAAHGLVLGEATAQSALGSPLRVVIPISTGPGEVIQPDCFRVVSAAGDGSAAFVTAGVSLERATAAPRLVVTTTNSVNEPAIRFGIQAVCDGLTQRAYVLLLDPPESDVPAAATAKPAPTRESRQERLVPPTAAVRRNPSVAAPAPTQVVHVPSLAERAAPAPLTQVVHVPSMAERAAPAPLIAPEPSVSERATTAGRVGSSPFLQVAATTTTALPPFKPLPARVPVVEESGSGLAYFLAVGFAIVGALALAVLFARRRQAPPAIPEWTRGPSYGDTRSSFTDLSAAPVTLPHTLSHVEVTSNGKSNSRSRSATAGGLPSRSNPAPVDPSTIDTLLDATDSDFVEERAVREAWAAARSDVERELDGNAILQAIEEAERDMQLAPPPSGQSAIERALEDDLLQPPGRR